MAHSVYMTEIAQKADTVRFTLYEKAKLDVAKIPDFVASYNNSLKFSMDTKAPYFTSLMKKNSRDKNTDVMAVINKILSDVKQNLCIKKLDHL